MDVKYLTQHLDYFATTGTIISSETRTLLLNSLTMVKKLYRFKSMQFWGKIITLKEDYFIIRGIKQDNNEQTLYSVNALDWAILEDATDEEARLARSMRGRFTGDPSFKYICQVFDEDFQQNENEPAAVHSGQYVTAHSSKNGIRNEGEIFIKEETRLSVVVNDINNSVMIHPRNSEPKSQNSKCSASQHGNETQFQQVFSGFATKEECCQLSNWVSPKRNLCSKQWSIKSVNCCMGSEHSYVLFSNLLWLGAMAVYVPGRNVHSKIYVGTGEMNIDLPHML